MPAKRQHVLRAMHPHFIILPPYDATAWTHLPEVGIALRTGVWTAPQSETVKLRTVSRAKYLQGISAISASDLPISAMGCTANLVSVNTRIFRNFRYPF